MLVFILEGFIFLVVILPSILPAMLGYNILGTDTVMHLARSYQFHQAFLSGQLPPRWAATLFYQYGLPAFAVGSNLGYYLIELFLRLKATYAQAYVIVEVGSYVLSSLGIYLAARVLFKKSFAALVTTAIWTYATYRMVDIYSRSAFWELTASIFPGWSLFAVLISHRSRLISLILQTFLIAWLLMAHLPSALVFLPMPFFFILFVSKQKISNFLILLTSLFIGFGISSFMTIPTLFERNYLLATRTLNNVFTNYFILPWDSLARTPSVGWITVIVILLSLLWVLKKRQDVSLIFFAVFIFGISLFLSWNISSVLWTKIPFFKFILFPFRFFALAAFAAAIALGTMFKDFKASIYLKSVMIVILTIILSYNFWGSVKFVNDWPLISRLDFANYHESAAAWDEILPTGLSYEVKKGLIPSDPQVISGEGQVAKITDTGREKVFVVETTLPSVISTGTLYYPGWQTIVDDQERFPSTSFVSLNNKDYSGLIVQPVGFGRHLIKIRFQETPLRLFANLISVFFIGIWFLLVVIFLLSKKREKVLK